MAQYMRFSSKSITLEAIDHLEGIFVNFTYNNSNYPNFRINERGKSVHLSSCNIPTHIIGNFHDFFQGIATIVICLMSIDILPVDQQFVILEVYLSNFMKIFNEEFQIFTR